MTKGKQDEFAEKMDELRRICGDTWIQVAARALLMAVLEHNPKQGKICKRRNP